MPSLKSTAIPKASVSKASVSKASVSKASVSKADYEYLAAFRSALREFLHFSEEAALAAGVPPQQHQAMLLIRGFPGRDFITVSELASNLKIKHHSAVGLANRMETERLIVKSQDPGDRRQVLIRLTAAGEKTLQRLSAAHKAELARIAPAFRKILNHLKAAQ
jgi:DNA-binding MarR family transcriptional regulator